MDQTKESLLRPPNDPNKEVPGYTNWIICGALMVIIISADMWLLISFGLPSWTSPANLGNIYFLLFHASVSVLWTSVLVLTYLDTVPMVAKYRPPGNTHIPVVQHSFVHSGRWTTFTLWCNSIGACYFWLVTLVSFLMIGGGGEQLPKSFAIIMGILWDICFPMSFLVNLVVTFILIPAKKRNGDFVGLWHMLKWRGQALHNGYVICVALEACLTSPSIPLTSFPVIVLYGSLYIVFSYVLYAKTGIFHYFFLDPRWKLAPLGIAGLLILLAGLFCAGSFAMQEGAHSWFARGAVLIAALGTCTFRDGAAVAPDTQDCSAQA